MKKQNGITLIALVITIIVLLILAGVSIAMLTGDNGILNKARSTQAANDKAEVMERVNMELNAQMANALEKKPFDSADDIATNLGMDSASGKIAGYDVAVVSTQKETGKYGENAEDKVTITITDPNSDFSPNIGSITYTNSTWKIDAVKLNKTTTEEGA